MFCLHIVLPNFNDIDTLKLVNFIYFKFCVFKVLQCRDLFRVRIAFCVASQQLDRKLSFFSWLIVSIELKCLLHLSKIIKINNTFDRPQLSAS